MKRLAEQLPALLHLVGRHVVQPGVVRVLLVGLAELGVDLVEQRVLRPGFAWRSRLRELRQPQLEALVSRVGRQQAVNGRRARAREAGDEDGSLDRDVDVLWVLLERRLRDETSDQRVADEEALHLAAELGEVGVAPERVEQYPEGFAVVVGAGTKVVQPAGLYGRGVQIVDGAYVGPAGVSAHVTPCTPRSSRPEPDP